MKFSSRRYPLLADDNWFNFRFGFLHQYTNPEKTLIGIQSGISESLSLVGKNVSYISDEFFQAVADNEDHFLSSDYDGEVEGEPYLMVHRGNIFLGIAEKICFLFMGHDLISCVGRMDGNLYLHADHRLTNQDRYREQTFRNFTYFTPRLVMLFKKYANVKTKTLPPKSKIEDFHCKYKSDLNVTIELLTANWYTESIQKHPFMVRGHWRMQSYGPKHSLRKLTYIDPFMKSGYTKGPYMND